MGATEPSYRIDGTVGGEVSSPDDIESMMEPVPEMDESGPADAVDFLEVRREELESESREVLDARAESLGLKISPRASKSTVVDRILALESSSIPAAR